MSNAVKGAPSGDHQNYIVTFDGPDAAEKAAQAQAMLGLQGIAPNVLSAPKNGRLVVQITPDQVDALEKSGARCYVDQEVTIPAPERLLNRSSPQLKVRDALSGEGRFSVDTHGADKLHAQGYKGSRVDLCVVDTGIDGTHPDIPTIEQGNFDDVFTPAPFDPPTDGNSHGTHCTGSAAGTQTVSGGKLGMAPEVRLFGAKVLDDSGSGSFSSIMKGVEFAIEKAKNSDRPMVVSMSLGGTARNPAADDPLVQMIEKATKEHGVLFVIAAGNSGPRANTINTPGIAPSAITVAAFDTRNTVSLDDDRVARFSSRGGTRRPSMDNKPDIGANGVNEFSTVPGGQYRRLSGTSMATPNVAGAACLLLDVAEDLFAKGLLTKSPKQMVKDGDIKRILMESALDTRAGQLDEGAGILRADVAVTLLRDRFGSSFSPLAMRCGATRSAPTSRCAQRSA